MEEEIKVRGGIKIMESRVIMLTGVDLTFRDEFFTEFRKNVAEHPEADYSDIRITINGIKKSITWEEFKERLGF